jgi:DNA polymerase
VDARDARDEIAEIAAGLRAEIERRKSFGRERERIPSTRVEPGTPAVVEHELTPQPTHRSSALVAPRSPSIAGEETRRAAAACATLDELRLRVAACSACGLSATRTQTVFMDGPPAARILFVGEAPGQHEDEQGIPFVGAAGQVLTAIIEKGMGLTRRDVVIANVLKCRPPNNRPPEASEKSLCTPYLDRQIELVGPELVIALGLHAAQHLLKSNLSLTRLRGRVHSVGGRKVIATFHPSALLRDPRLKKDCWVDIQMALKELGLPVPASTRKPAEGAG